MSSLQGRGSCRGWDLDTFNSIPPEQRDAIIKALNDDTNKLLSELDPNDPLAIKLKEELRLTNEHFLKLLNASQRQPGELLALEEASSFVCLGHRPRG